MYAKTDWFVNCRFGMFIHWGLYSLAARHEWIQNHEKLSAKEYENKYFNKFEPDLYNPTKWAQLASQAGMKYFVITAKHHEGFCLWDTQYTSFKAPASPAKKDMLKPMVEAFRAEGLKVGFYYSLIDWHHPEFTIDKHHPLRNDQEARKREKNRDIKKYAKYMQNQVRELLTDYGKIDLLWFDFSYPGKDGKGHEDWQSVELLKMVRELQPNIMVTNRLDLPEKPDFMTPEQYMPHTCPKYNNEPIIWEGCHTFSGSWGYYRDEASWKSDKQCIWMLVDSVSKGGNLLMNVGPTARGEFDERSISKLNVYAKWMKYNSRSIYGCGQAPKEFIPPEGTILTYNHNTNRMYIHLLNWPFWGLYLPKCFKGKIEYAQLLNDSSELLIEAAKHNLNPGTWEEAEDSLDIIKLPVKEPSPIIPVIELFLK